MKGKMAIVGNGDAIMVFKAAGVDTYPAEDEKKAKEVLKSDHESISDIAYSLGYADIYDFSRAFKKRVGMSPTEYAKSESNKN